MNKVTFLLDAGHGGMINNIYQTAKTFNKNNPATWIKSWYHKSDDLSFFEGVFNRQIIDKVKKLMHQKQMSFLDVVDSEQDVPLVTRITTANNFYKKNRNCVYFSMHGNASGKGSAQGIEIFTSKGETLSDFYVKFFFNEIVKEFPNEKYRFDKVGKVDKESNLFVLGKTNMPAFLFEFLFFDNLIDVRKMVNPEIQDRLAKAIVSGFEQIQNNFVFAKMPGN